MTDDHITNKLIKKEVYLNAFYEFEKEIFSDSWNYHEDNVWSFLVKKYGNSIGIFKQYIYSYKRNKDSLNAKSGNIQDLKNKLDRLKKFRLINYNMSLPEFQYNLRHNFKKYCLLKNNEIKNKLVYVLLKSMEFYRNKKPVYKMINFVLHKLSDNKIILFYADQTLVEFFKCININVFDSLIKTHKHIISLNVNNFVNINDINNYIFPNDILIFLNNYFLFNESKIILESHTNNKMFVFINNIENMKFLKNNKNIIVYSCNNNFII